MVFDVYRIKSPDSEVSGDRQRTPFDSLVSPPGTHPSPPSVGASGLLDKGNTCRCPLIHDISPPSACSQILPDKGKPSRCPLINEDLMTEGNNGRDKASMDLRTLNIRQSLSDSRLKEDSPVSSEDTKTYHRSPELLEVPSPRLLPPTRPNTMTGRPLFSVHSSPQLLNEICEECESDSEGGMEDLGSRSHTFRQQNTSMSQAIVSPEVMRKFERLHKMRPSASQRATSCSSSDTSDTDEVDLSRIQTDMTKQKFRRRDSSEHSSDTDGAPSGPSSFSSSGAGRSPAISGNTHGGQSGSRGKGDAGKGKEKTSESNQGKNSSQNIKNEKRERTTKVGQHLSNRVAPANVGSTQCKFGDTGKKATSQGGTKTGPNKRAEVQLTLNCVIEVQAYECDTPPTKDKTSSQMIHVRSKNFNDLVQKFSTKGEGCPSSNNGQIIKNESTGCGLHHLSGTRSKTDANNLTAAASKCGRTDRMQRLTLGNQTWPRGRKISI